jgi:hypothetical protein
MAQRKLKNLAASKLVIPRLDAHGTRSWVLSTAGAALVDAQDGYELNPAGGTYSHHHLGSRYLIFKQATHGYACYSEHAFTHNRAPFRASDLLATLGKVPDGINVAGWKSSRCSREPTTANSTGMGTGDRNSDQTGAPNF